VDDLEDDEAVESDERRAKLKTWFMKALIPCLSEDRGEVRIVGTILHLDSVLSMCLKSPSWKSKLYKAHRSFEDFSDLLWPEMHTEERLREKRQEYIDMGDPEGYSQEYLNDPADLQNPFFRDEDFIPMDEDDEQRPKSYYVGVDFALSDQKYSDYTVMTVGGYDSKGLLHIVDERRMRTDDVAKIIDELFSVAQRYTPDMFLIEGGVIANAITPAWQIEMRKRNLYSAIHTYTPIQDKKRRAAAIQARMRVGGVRYNSQASWYEDHKNELRKFPRGERKDRVDALAWLGRGVEEFVEAPTQDELIDIAWQNEYQETYLDHDTSYYTGTGY